MLKAQKDKFLLLLMILPFVFIVGCNSEAEFGSKNPSSQVDDNNLDAKENQDDPNGGEAGSGSGGDDDEGSTAGSGPNVNAAASQGEDCKEGKILAIWLDPNQTGTTSDENFLGEIISYKGEKTGKENYNYYSASAHPIMGPTPKGFEVNAYFYEGPDGLSFQFFSSIDGGGADDDILELDITTLKNQSKDSVLLSDDNAEVKLIKKAADQNEYTVRAHYWKNTDGGVIGPFEGEDFLIQVTVVDSGDNQNARFHSANSKNFALKDSDNNVSSFVITSKGTNICDK